MTRSTICAECRWRKSTAAPHLFKCLASVPLRNFVTGEDVLDWCDLKNHGACLDFESKPRPWWRWSASRDH